MSSSYRARVALLACGLVALALPAFASPPASPGPIIDHPLPVRTQPPIVHPGLRPEPFDIIIDLKLPKATAAPTPVPTATPTPGTTPSPQPTFAQAPMINIGAICSNLSVTLAKLVATEGTPGQPPAAITAPLGTVKPVTNGYVGIGCVATFTDVPRNFPLLVSTKYAGAPVGNTPVGGWSNPFTVKTSDPLSPATHHQFREMTIAIP